MINTHNHIYPSNIEFDWRRVYFVFNLEKGYGMGNYNSTYIKIIYEKIVKFLSLQ